MNWHSLTPTKLYLKNWYLLLYYLVTEWYHFTGKYKCSLFYIPSCQDEYRFRTEQWWQTYCAMFFKTKDANVLSCLF